MYTSAINSTITTKPWLWPRGSGGRATAQWFNRFHHMFGACVSASPIPTTQPIGVVPCLLTALISSTINAHLIDLLTKCVMIPLTT